ncbi:MAG TPA: oligosaccharide flippase family protein [Bacteroidales bacterium]|jgi:O-antigen/teichoic acid export membrane protein|nr:oligosaccharide flippase family protein [Bacteroidales bacterium]HNY56904.1 oligosaccharide flippase family protein [Bacteroidales bacterium]HOH14066.1 oligosaccharide flippase family protein [Bacteroidales bacterium]HPX53240.1 oligosaccharide flippase family protein [Bacteroidales bacterium]HQB51736.1 oligosaccharide flippase family protein [Bacteroidales bacterium]
MNDISKLAGQTVIYGFGTVVPRFLNYALLTPFYTRILGLEQYGVVTELYAWMVLALVILTYGMETTYFRFAGKKANAEVVYGTAMISLFTTSAMFIMAVSMFITPISGFLGYAENPEYIRMFAWIVAIDAFSAIPFAWLRNNNRAALFSALKIINVIVTIVLAFFFLKIAPSVAEKGNRWIYKVWNPDFQVGYVFVANLAGSAITLLCLTPFIFRMKPVFDRRLLRKMLAYSWPLLVGGMAGSLNEVLDKILLRRLIGGAEGLATVGLYGAGYKVGVLMSLFIQMYRFAAEPFFFDKAGSKDAKETYAITMKYFVITAVILFLGINLYPEIVSIIIGENFRESMNVVPIISMGYLLLGIYINQSIWYKVDDKTIYGVWITLVGVAVTVAVNLVFVPLYGYIAAAWAHVACYLSMVIVSYFVGQKYYPIEYEKGRIVMYIALALAMLFISMMLSGDNKIVNAVIDTMLLLVFFAVAEYRDKYFTILFKKGS